MAKPLIVANAESEPATAGEIVAEGAVSQPLAVRETRRLYRLRAARFLAVVAADTEAEARALAASHDALRGDCNPQFALAEFDDNAEAHVFGDVVISVQAAPPIARSKKC
jgi:alkanesulfonate monooxygenase SsuD/methylene tetrahydromethanopterin reductase-like flavin-dependent oxidoreductase (luciferase family)